MLRVNRVPPGDPTTSDSVGQNRFECPTCPYQLVLSKRFYERKYLKKKEVEDILGGKGAWDNVDQTEGELKIYGRVGMGKGNGERRGEGGS
jgi:DNA-directed RNA polymerase III subunit RPC11